MEDCIFCKIVSGDMPSYKIYEDDNTLAILDIYPVTPGHVLVLPKKHFDMLSDVDEETGIELFKTLLKIEKVVAKSGNLGVNILQNNGKAAWQEVFHVHFHVIPRFQDDGLKMKIRRNKNTDEMLKHSQNYYINKIKEI
jgi:histidine triad (HIT) family protein